MRREQNDPGSRPDQAASGGRRTLPALSTRPEVEERILSEKEDRNKRVQTRYDELMKIGRHGHYETLFQIVREEVERDRATRPRIVN